MQGFAIVGLDCLLPGADTPEAWFGATAPAIIEVPEGRWPPAARAQPAARAGTPDRTTSVRGAFVVDPPAVGLPDVGGFPILEVDPLFRWVLRTVGRALRPARVDRARTGLVLANLALPTTGAVRAAGAPLAARLGIDVPWLHGGHPADLHHTGAPARLAAEAFGLGAGADALDAACASGLYAVLLACDALASGHADAMVAAAVSRADSAYLFHGFSQLRALSPDGSARPLDRRANGLVIGEGAAAVVIKRLDDAVRDGDTIRAVVRGGGLGNDGRKGNMLAPSTNGQLRTLRAAWADAALDPRTLGYLECHATGTRLGDTTEVRTLAALLDEVGPWRGSPLALASAKALVGHTVTVAGLAGLLRAVGAVEAGSRPPAVGCEEPVPAIADDPRLTTLSEPQPWPEDRPRRAAVSAFGFGGTNAHVIVDAWEGTSAAPRRAAATPPLAVVGVAVQVGAHRGAPALTALATGAPADAPASAHRGLDLPDGTYVPEVVVDPRRYRIPPLELADLLPQQLLALDLAADAIDAAGPLDRARTASIVGMRAEPHVADATVRLALGRDAGDAVAPVLTASRVQGSLPNFVANRIAAQFDLRGPSFSVSAGAASALVALHRAGRLLATGAVDAAVVGAVDLPGHAGAAQATPGPIGEGGAVFVVRRLADAEADGVPILAVLSPVALGPTRTDDRRPSDHHATVGDAGAADGALALAAVVLGPPGTTAVAVGGRRVEVEARDPIGDRPLPRWTPVLAVPHSGPVLPRADRRWTGSFGGDTVPLPVPGAAPPPVVEVPPNGPPAPTPARLQWHAYLGLGSPTSRGAPARQHHPAPAPPAVRPPARTVVRPAVSAHRRSIAPEGLTALVDATARTHTAIADAHERWLTQELAARARITTLGERLARALDPSAVPTPAALPAARPPTPPRATRKPTRPAGPPPIRAPRSATATAPSPRPTHPKPVEPTALFDRAALEVHATGLLSAVFGPEWADLDRHTPRVRMPTGPLLLCDRVTALEGTPGTLGPSAIVTEYDIPTGKDWSHDGRPPACVVVESGQADLFLVSWLRIDAICRGERLYRLLDCDLTFHARRPEAGTTLRHDIRIERFARLGATTLFYFGYDCATADGTPILTMRGGCAGFFTPDELASPRGLDAAPRPLTADPVAPLIAGAATTLDTDAVTALARGRLSIFGPAFAALDHRGPTLPDSHWRLVHRAEVHLTGGPHGLGLVRATQDLADDDWFNPVHFQDDPCMPGTLMLEGCLQAVQVWLLATGVTAAFPDGAFEPLAGRAMRLRCRGQVAPGHRTLTYEARVHEADLSGDRPYAVADVLLSVDGVPVVIAQDVGVAVHGTRQPLPTPVAPLSDGVDEARLLAFSVGSAAQAFGPGHARYDAGERCPRMPGPPFYTLSRILSVDGAPGVAKAPADVHAAWALHPDGWSFQVAPGDGLPLGMLLEAALQPCGWLTAYQGQHVARPDLFFRNLGGTLTVHRAVGRHDGALHVRATQTSIAASGDLAVQFFDTAVALADGTPVASGSTHFGYFTPAALDGQKGLQPAAAVEAARDRWRAGGAVDRDLADHPALPRADWALLDRLVCADPTGGPQGAGWYATETDLDPDAWFFDAHFMGDPVMPGSLGIDAVAQLARVVFHERTGALPGRVEAPAAGTTLSWRYRGQIRQGVQRMQVELEVRSITPDRLVADGLVRADGLPIYRVEGLELAAGLPPLPTPVAAPPSRPAPRAGLLDTFVVDGDTGVGTFRLDPAHHAWLDDHRPTVTAPALPLAFAAEIAAEAAVLLRPGATVRGLPELTAERWVHAGDGPADVHVVAVADGDVVAVTLAMHVHNPRYRHLSGLRPHMRAVVELGAHHAPVAAPAVDAPAVRFDVRDYYDGGHTFHGPALQPMTALTRLNSRSAVATLAPGPAGTPAYVLDPHLLDGATHPMLSSTPEHWHPEVGPGHLAYPVRCDHLRFFRSRPTAPVTCTLQRADGPPRTLCFDVHLAGPDGPWCSFRWTEAIVPAGPLLSHPAPVRRRFLWDGAPCPEITLGRATPDGWEVRTADLVEPLDGTLVAAWSGHREREAWRTASDRAAHGLALLAAKEAVRAHLRGRQGRDVHPRSLELVRLGITWVVREATTLDAQTFATHLGPTRWTLEVDGDATRAVARIGPRGNTAR